VIRTDKPPYPGLRPFDRDESHLFFGRDHCIDAMIAKLGERRFLAVLGSSGTGKSSLVKTGLFSGLEMGLLPGAGSRWLIVDFRPGGDPLANLARALLEAESSVRKLAAPDAAAVAALQARFKREGPRELMKWCREGHLPEGTNLLILVDQFEELFRYQNLDQREDVQALISLLLESRWPRGVPSPQASELPIYVAITMRSEYLGACALVQGLAEAINEGTFLTPRMKRQECEEAIVGPARVCGTAVEPRLVTKLLNDMADFAPWELDGGKDQLSQLARQADQLPLMQHALNRMWQRARQQGEPITLRFDDYRGLEQELDEHAEQVLGKLDAPARIAAECVFEAVTFGTTVANAVRRPTQYRDLVEICSVERSDDVAKVVAEFGPQGCQFLTSDIRLTGARPPDHAWIDISHESLIRQWKRLSGWLEAEGRAAHYWQQLKDQAERNELLGWRGLSNALRFRKGQEPTDAWAKRYGGGFDQVIQLINRSRLRRYMLVAAYSAIGVLGLGAGYFVYHQHVEASQKSIIAAKNFELAVTSAQKLLDKLSTSVDRGEITVKGANDMLRAAQEIVEQVHKVENTIDTISLLVKLGHTASDIHATLGNYTLAFDSAKEARDFAEKLRASNPDNQEVLQLLYGSIWRMGDAISYRGVDRGTQQRALNEYLEAQKIARRLAQLAPTDGARQRELMFIHHKIGDVHKALEEIDIAIAEYQIALTLIRGVVAGAPENRVWRRDLATALRRIGQALSDKKDFDGALAQLNAAGEIISVLVREDPNDNIVRSNQASNHRDVAVVYAQRADPQRGDIDAALAEYRNAIAIQERLIARDRENATWQFSLAAFYSAVGEILRRQGDLEGALDHYRKAHALRTQLAIKDPTNSGRQNRLALAAISVADVLQEQKQHLDEVMQLCRSAIEILDEARPRYDRNVFDCYIKIGDVLTSRADRDEALKQYKVAAAIARERLGENSTSVVWQRSVAISYERIGDVLAAQSPAEAIEQYQKALEIIVALIAKYPRSPEWPPFAERLKAKIQSPTAKP
jgi:tetratricopeptide (TPR) repeat protein